MGREDGHDERTVASHAAVTGDIDQQLQMVLDRIQGICSLLAEEIVLFDYLTERKLRHELDAEDLQF